MTLEMMGMHMCAAAAQDWCTLVFPDYKSMQFLILQRLAISSHSLDFSCW